MGEILDIRRIYLEPAAAELPRGQEVLSRYPEATIVEVESHQRIPELYGDETNVRRWVRIKREALVLGVKKTMTARPNGRSADFIAPSTANGCAMACAYCYVPRHKGYSNPITVFANIERITGYLDRHVKRQGVKPEPNACDPVAWVYDIGENSDCSLDARISDNVRDLVTLFRGRPTAKASFATKHVNRDLLDWDPRNRTRIRFSLMPQADAKVLDIRTSPIAERIAAIDDFVEAGYEVHVNFSPVVVRDGWLDDWRDLLGELDAGIGVKAKEQLAAEIIFLTHNRNLHEINLGWHPKAEELIWRPDLQQVKRSQNGDLNVRYRTGSKHHYVNALTDLITERAPYIKVRYAF
ncbi:spore photoproduct lyase family protein [Actinoplanes sp. OR16]|uniref:spore photoproduct lyase family protein n=1 Tax=Actinoplanes sp. OR16 TaxID=946334 RepID=UPI000F71F4F1|nr:spore photoproduct lyase family protein [Actinoplanes sp. OR16]BBH70456.1 spore photoproduct lyase family protein [Actinoplanes sp. OR16]